MRPSLLLPLLLLGGAVSAKPASTPLRFAWPGGLEAQVELHIQGEREVGDATQRHDARARFTLSTALQGKELHVKRASFQGWEGQLPARMGAATDRLVDRIPLVRVSREGEFLGIDGAAQAREAFAREVKPESLDPLSRRLFDGGTTDAALNAIALDFWNTSVGIWTETKLRPGTSKELRNRTSLPQLGGGQIDLVLTLRRSEPVACSSEEKLPRCVELTLESKPDRQQVKELLRKVLASAAGPGPVTQDFEMTQTLRAVVEPDTLVPHHLTLRRATQLRLRAPDGKTQAAREQTERTYVLRYAPPATKPTP